MRHLAWEKDTPSSSSSPSPSSSPSSAPAASLVVWYNASSCTASSSILRDAAATAAASVAVAVAVAVAFAIAVAVAVIVVFVVVVAAAPAAPPLPPPPPPPPSIPNDDLSAPSLSTCDVSSNSSIGREHNDCHAALRAVAKIAAREEMLTKASEWTTPGPSALPEKGHRRW